MSIYHLLGVAKFESTGIFGIEYNKKTSFMTMKKEPEKIGTRSCIRDLAGYLYTSGFLAGGPDGRHI